MAWCLVKQRDFNVIFTLPSVYRRRLPTLEPEDAPFCDDTDPGTYNIVGLILRQTEHWAGTKF
jgi:hypothetical protein